MSIEYSYTFEMCRSTSSENSHAIKTCALKIHMQFKHGVTAKTQALVGTILLLHAIWGSIPWGAQNMLLTTVSVVVRVL